VDEILSSPSAKKSMQIKYSEKPNKPNKKQVAIAIIIMLISAAVFYWLLQKVLIPLYERNHKNQLLNQRN
jgi:hypothetical protein